jgi:hypothetical protein
MRRELFGDRLLQIRTGVGVETLLPESDPDKAELKERFAALGIQHGECFIHPVDNTPCRLLIEANPLWSEAGGMAAIFENQTTREQTSVWFWLNEHLHSAMEGDSAFWDIVETFRRADIEFWMG